MKYWIYHIDGILVLICVLAKDLSHLQSRPHWMNRQSRSHFRYWIECQIEVTYGRSPALLKATRNASSFMMSFMSPVTTFDLFILCCISTLLILILWCFWLLVFPIRFEVFFGNSYVFVILIDSPFPAVFSIQKPSINICWINCEGLNIENTQQLWGKCSEFGFLHWWSNRILSLCNS